MSADNRGAVGIAVVSGAVRFRPLTIAAVDGTSELKPGVAQHASHPRPRGLAPRRVASEASEPRGHVPTTSGRQHS